MDGPLDRNGGRSRSRSPRREDNQKKAPDPAAIALKQAKLQEKRDRERIRRLLITLGDDNKKVQGQIKGLVGALEDDVELHGELIRETIVECVMALPTKTGIFAAWVARMSRSHGDFIASLVCRCLEELRGALRAGAGRVTAAQLLLRFFVCLGNAGYLPLPSLVALLREILALSDGLKPQKGGDFGVFLMLSSLPFISPAAYSLITGQVDGLVAAGATYISAREASWKSLLRLLDSDDTPQDRLDSLMSALQSLKVENWASDAVFHVPGYEPNNNVPDEPAIPPLGVSAEEMRKANKVRFQPPLKTSRLVTNKLALEGADDQMSEHDWWVLEDYLLMIVEMFAKDIDECSKQLLRIPLLHPHFEAIIVETLFSQMLRLPNPAQLPLFYSRLLQALVDKQFSVKQVLERAYAALFEQLPVLDEDAVEVLAEAYAYHLHVNGYQADWSAFTEDGVAVSLQRFLRRALERLQRLSFHDNVLHKVPQAIHPYVPPDPGPSGKFDAKKDLEFGRMVGVVRIKDSDEKLVMKYCRRLMRLCAKDEEDEDVEKEGNDETVEVVSSLKVETPAAELKHKEGLPTVSSDTGAVGDEKREEAQEGDSEAARCQAGDAKLELESGGASEPVNRTSPEDAAAPEAKRPRLDEAVKTEEGVSEEVKREEKEDATPSSAAVGAQVVETKKKEEDTDHDFGSLPLEPWTVESTLELLVSALLQGGAKTPTHWNRMLGGHQKVLEQLLLLPTDKDACEVSAATSQHIYAKAVVSAVFDFWDNSAQRLEITVDSLLQRELVTPLSVVEFALSCEKRGIAPCDSMPTWNVVHSVLRKSIEKSQTARVENALAKKLGQTEILARTKPAAEKASAETSEVFASVFASLVACHKNCGEDVLLRRTMLQRLAGIGRKYHAFIRPLIDAAESKIKGVSEDNPEIVRIFSLLRTL